SHPVDRFLAIADPRARAIATLRVQDRRFAVLPRAEAAARVEARMAQETRFMGHASNASGYLRLLAARAGHDCAERLDRIGQPTLVLTGRHDDQSPLALSHTLAHGLPRGTLSEHDAGHGLLFTDPTAVAAVLPFLKEHAP
ncbi:MAG: alpha/beta hydrolase, partial [Jannaschia sp.]